MKVGDPVDTTLLDRQAEDWLRRLKEAGVDLSRFQLEVYPLEMVDAGYDATQDAYVAQFWYGLRLVERPQDPPFLGEGI